MAATAHLDLETRSPVDLKTAGLHKYFEDERTEVLVELAKLADLRDNNVITQAEFDEQKRKLLGQ